MRELVAQRLGEIPVDPPVLLLQRDGEGEDLALGKESNPAKYRTVTKASVAFI